MPYFANQQKEKCNMNKNAWKVLVWDLVIIFTQAGIGWLAFYCEAYALLGMMIICIVYNVAFFIHDYMKLYGK
jgi:hypothetical protein